ILAIYPLLKEGIINPKNIVVDAKSGVSGAGKKLALTYLYNEANENFMAYAVTNHRHTPEVEQILGDAVGSRPVISFVPHLTPMIRGIESDIYADAIKKIKAQELQNIYETYYGAEKFVRVLPQGTFPATRNVYRTNFCDISAALDERTNKAIVISAIDNLVKGASGQAVQNMNIMFGFKEDMGLL
ncbi:MAG: N-acetyl-gamma-glutamyl-phosphate reductase, partial [Elusimicrobiota bacterium]